jgi:hypothetical protein
MASSGCRILADLQWLFSKATSWNRKRTALAVTARSPAL